MKRGGRRSLRSPRGAGWLVLAACGGEAGDPRCAIDGIGVDPSGEFCEQLSSYGLFEDLATQAPTAGLVAYSINTPLFSDYTVKDRFVFLPPGTAMTWSDDGAFDLPTGGAVIKTFSYPVDRRDPALGRRLLETRLLVRTADAWTGAAYVYDETGNDAKLALAGAFLDTSWVHDDGTTLTNRYVVPNKNQCKNCHAESADAIDLLGPKARHLNRDGQLEQLVDTGLLAGAPDPTGWPRAPVSHDPTTGTLDERARAWLDINCGYCHNANGGAARTSGLYLDLAAADPSAMGVCKPPIAAGGGSGGRAFGIVPGNPDASILIYRLESIEAEIKMPELGRNLVDAEGLALMREWIAAMPGGCE